MIITKIIGGLGNQLFQYAIGKSIALENKTTLKIDITDFERYKLRTFELHKFKINSPIAGPRERPVKFSNARHRRYESTVNRLLGKPRIINERSLSYDPTVQDLKGNIYLDGYWQSPRYFSKHWNTIRAEYDINFLLKPTQMRLIDSMLSGHSVALHVRRGDYVQVERNRAIYAECTKDYYNASINYLLERFPELEFYIFSDDIPWVRANLRLPASSIFVEGNDAPTDLKMMSSCHHSIIANSTFSWWASFLKPQGDPSCVTIAPLKWFVQEKKNAEIGDLIPAGWIRL